MAASTRYARWRKALRFLAVGLPVLLVGIQFVPYGRDHSNPPVVLEPRWDSPSTRTLAVRACFDCHSNETHWPWYSHVAPMSWRLQSHVEEGRRVLNFSEWQRPSDAAFEAAETVRTGEMPLPSYLILHPEARLSPEEKRALEQGLAATFGSAEGGGEEAHEGHEHEGSD